jgi:hypothetical protein
MDGLDIYVGESVAPAVRKSRRLSVYLGLAVLLAAMSLVAVRSHSGGASAFPRVLVPGSSAACTSPPNGFLFSQTVDGAQMNVCISQEGNINQIQYPDTAVGHTQIAFDAYCLIDSDTTTTYVDAGSGSGVGSSGFGSATFTQTASNIFNVTRNTTDGKYQFTEFIKINFQPRSIFVGMTVKNIDPSNATHTVAGIRSVGPAIDGNAADDQYNEFGVGLGGTGRTGQASQSPGPGTNSLLFGPTQSSAVVFTETYASFVAASGCGGTVESSGFVTGGNRVFSGALFATPTIAHNQSVSLGKFVYRML